MSWEDVFRDHPVWEAANGVLDALRNSAEVDDLSSQLAAVVAQIPAFKDSANASLPIEDLDQTERMLNAIQKAVPDSVASVFARPSTSPPTDSLFVRLARMVRSWPPTGSIKLSGLSQQLATVEAKTKALKRAVEDDLDHTRAKIDQFITKGTEEVRGFESETSESMNARLDEVQRKTHDVATEIAQRSEGFTTEIEQRTAQFKGELDQLRETANQVVDTTQAQAARLDEALNSFQESFARKQEERTEAWSEWMAEREREAKLNVGKMEVYKNQSSNLLSAIGVNATATSYGDYAKGQAAAANGWRWGAVVAFSLAAIFFLAAASMSFFGLGTDLAWWQVVFQKVGAPAGAAAVGYFLARESGQHREQERMARQIQLTLTALDPFIANLPEEQKEKIRVDVARSLFMQRNATAQLGTIEKDPAKTTAETDTAK